MAFIREGVLIPEFVAISRKTQLAEQRLSEMADTYLATDDESPEARLSSRVLEANFNQSRGVVSGFTSALQMAVDIDEQVFAGTRLALERDVLVGLAAGEALRPPDSRFLAELRRSLEQREKLERVADPKSERHLMFLRAAVLHESLRGVAASISRRDLVTAERLGDEALQYAARWPEAERTIISRALALTVAAQPSRDSSMQSLGLRWLKTSAVPEGDWLHARLIARSSEGRSAPAK
jgi:hypothetical protein